MNIYRGRTHTDVFLASILYESIEDRDIRSVRQLLVEKRADPNVILPGKGISCLHLAIGNDSESFAMEVTSLIIQNGGNPNVLSDDGLTPLHIAAAWGRVNILKLLLQCGGDPQLTDNYYKTALNYALDESWDDAANIIKDFISSQRLSIHDNFSTKACRIALDKVLLSNGAFIGEYQVTEDDEKEQDSEYNNHAQLELNTLPETSSQEYVLSWCNKHKARYNSLDDDDCHPKPESRGNTAFVQGHEDTYSSKDSSMGSNYQDEGLPNSNSCSSVFSHRKTCRRRFANNTSKNNRQFNDYISKDICKHKESSRESGILTLQDSSVDCEFLDECLRSDERWNSNELIKGIKNLNITPDRDTSSDYCTCTEGSESANVLDKAIYPTRSAQKDSNEDDTDSSFVSVTEVYKYEDVDEGIVLYQKNLLVKPANSKQNESCSSLNASHISLPKSIDYDTDTLRKELTILGFDPGPITKTTKRVYLRKLYQLKQPSHTTPFQCDESEKVYSPELQRTVKKANWSENLSEYQRLEDVIRQEFTNPDTSRKWRGGTAKTSFTYLLLDSRITQNLPHRRDRLEEDDLWRIFLSAIFYVGKGKKSRPFAHLNEAINKYNKNDFKSDSDSKISRILDIWAENHGVICLHVFQNAIQAESYTREAAMISALNLQNITNMKGGEFYGRSATWTQKQKNLLGTYLLHRAMNIFLNEGERQIFPHDVK